MKHVVGVFGSRLQAQNASRAFGSCGIARERITLLTPEASYEEISRVPKTEAEQPGIGTVLAAVVGAGLGVAAGLVLGAIAGSVLIQGVGVVFWAGLPAIVLLGTAGALIGMAIGRAVDNGFSEGLPEDELFFYIDALKQGRSVVIATAADDSEVAWFRALLSEHQAEAIDAARGKWWLGLRGAEAEEYAAARAVRRHGRPNF